jgi:hypothetical protein
MPDLVLNIRSGGQTGVDRATLDAALFYNTTTSLPSFNSNNAKKPFHVHVTGWCPKGRLAEDGPIPSRYPLIETPTSLYSERTEWNVRDADATLVLLLSTTMPPDNGTTFTIEKVTELQKPLKIIFLNDDIVTNTSQVLQWMNDHQVKMLNVAGPRESNCPGIYSKTYDFMTVLLNKKIID